MLPLLLLGQVQLLVLLVLLVLQDLLLEFSK
jgi:hypothetical protein